MSMADMAMDEWDERFAAAGGRWWAVAGKSSGYALDVYPEEARKYRQQLKRGPDKLLGEYATKDEAEADVMRWLRGDG
jgi:hypothetical protein